MPSRCFSPYNDMGWGLFDLSSQLLLNESDLPYTNMGRALFRRMYATARVLRGEFGGVVGPPKGIPSNALTHILIWDGSVYSRFPAALKWSGFNPILI